ncbi:MAG: DnaA N-terminal domain-containing protein, partial [Planctomycetota bacterium]
MVKEDRIDGVGSPQLAAQHQAAAPQEPAAEQLVERLASTLGRQRYETWFEAQAEFRVANGGELHVLVGTPLHRDCLQRQFADDVRSAYAAVCGERRPVSFRVDAEERDLGPGDLAARQRGVPRKPATRPDAPLPTPRPNELRSLVVGDANKAAVTIARQVADGIFAASP